MTLLDYLNSKGRGAAKALAAAIGAASSDVSDWAHGHRPVPVHRCVPIERATEGAVTRRELRPDDWQLLWPELENPAA